MSNWERDWQDNSAAVRGAYLDQLRTEKEMGVVHTKTLADLESISIERRRDTMSKGLAKTDADIIREQQDQIRDLQGSNRGLRLRVIHLSHKAGSSDGLSQMDRDTITNQESLLIGLRADERELMDRIEKLEKKR